MRRLLVGYAIGIAAGLPLGLLTASSPPITAPAMPIRRFIQ
jgi:ABC-type nitrate/sulfonate/bicarbonate transport system permease component